MNSAQADFMSFQFSQFCQFMVHSQVAVFDSIMLYCSKHYLGLLYHCQFTAIIELKEVKCPPKWCFPWLYNNFRTKMSQRYLQSSRELNV